MVEKFIKPVLNGLAAQKGVQVFEDNLYKMNPNPGVLVSETWRKMWLPGYGPKPLTEAALQAAEAKQAAQITDLAQAQRDTGRLLKSLREHMGKAVDAGTDIGAAVKSFDAQPFKHLKHVDVWLPQLANLTYLEMEQE